MDLHFSANTENMKISFTHPPIHLGDFFKVNIEQNINKKY